MLIEELPQLLEFQRFERVAGIGSGGAALGGYEDAAPLRPPVGQTRAAEPSGPSPTPQVAIPTEVARAALHCSAGAPYRVAGPTVWIMARAGMWGCATGRWAD